MGFSEAEHCLVPALSVIPTLARIIGPGTLKPSFSALSQI